MFIINKVEYRNLQEQVLDNKNKIRAHWEVDRVLANFGIRVIGRVDTAADIETQPVPEGGYQYGDAYAVGPENTNYDYYIYTRPFAGETQAHWFYIGQLSIAGPAGERGLGLVILGTGLTSVDSLPTPTSVRRDGAYLVTINGEKHLYAITGQGTSADPLKWEDLGVYTLTSSGGGASSILYRHDIQIHIAYAGNISAADIYMTEYNRSPDAITIDTVWNILDRMPVEGIYPATGQGTLNSGEKFVITGIYRVNGDRYSYSFSLDYVYTPQGQSSTSQREQGALLIEYVTDNVTQI